MTAIIISNPGVSWVDPTADLLRERGLKVICLGTLSIIGFLLMSRKIAAVLVHEDRVPSEWEIMRERMARIAPDSRILIIPRDEQRSPAKLALLVTS